MYWIDVNKEKPNHKDLVLCWDGIIPLPAVYFDNQSFCGFYYFTTFYHVSGPTIYSKVNLEPEHKINGVLKWALIEKPSDTNENPWLSPIQTERDWQESHIKKIWPGYPNISPNWQIMNGLIRYSCEQLDIEITEPSQ